MLPTKLLTTTATVPTRGSEDAAGLDLYLDFGMQFPDMIPSEFHENRFTMTRGGHATLHTGIAVAIPKGYYGLISPRSGLANRNGIQVLGGVIDADYRGELMIMLKNGPYLDAFFSHGDRIAQMVILPVSMIAPALVAELPETERGDGKFGSTGQ